MWYDFARLPLEMARKAYQKRCVTWPCIIILVYLRKFLRELIECCRNLVALSQKTVFT